MVRSSKSAGQAAAQPETSRDAPRARGTASETAQRQREIQREQDSRDTSESEAKSKGAEQKGGSKTPAAKKASADKPAKPAVQAGAREQPQQFPAQHLTKPAHESELDLQPRFMAPDYEGSNKLQGRVALITGGDSGIGRAVAVLYAREGADVAIVYLDEHDDALRTQSCVEAEGQQCILIAGDVKDPVFCRDAVEQTVQAYGHLDFLVNNAGFQEHAGSIEELSDERFVETLHTNVLGYFHMAKAALQHLPRGGSIINTGSVTGLEGSKQLLDYSASKGAIHAFTKSLASSVLERGIRVNAVAPGPVWTPLNPADKQGEEVATFGQQTDMHRAAQPEELSPAYVFLAAPVCSGYISGIVLPVTGSVGAI